MFTQVEGDDDESFHQYINGTQVEDAVLSDFDAEELEADFASQLPPKFSSPTDSAAIQRGEEAKNASGCSRSVENSGVGKLTNPNRQMSNSIPTSAYFPAPPAFHSHSELTGSQNLAFSSSQLLMRPLPSDSHSQDEAEEENNVRETASALHTLKLQMLQKFGINAASGPLIKTSPTKTAASDPVSLPTIRSSPLAKISDIPDSDSNRTSASAQPFQPERHDQAQALVGETVNHNFENITSPAAVAEPVEDAMNVDEGAVIESLPAAEIVNDHEAEIRAQPSHPELAAAEEHAEEAALPLDDLNGQNEDQDDDEDEDDLINLRISQTQPQEMLVDEENENNNYPEQPQSPIRSPFKPVASAVSSPAESDTQEDIDLAILSAEEIPTETVVEQQQQSNEETLRVEDEDVDDDPAPNTAEPNMNLAEEQRQDSESEDEESVDLLRTGTVDTLQERQTMNPHHENIHTSAMSHSTLSTIVPVLPDEEKEEDEQRDQQPTPERKVSLEWIDARVHTSDQGQIIDEGQLQASDAPTQSISHERHSKEIPVVPEPIVKKRPASILNSLLVDLTMDGLEDRLDAENVDELEDEVEKKMAALLKLQEALKRRKDKGLKDPQAENVASSSSAVKSLSKDKQAPTQMSTEKNDAGAEEEEEQVEDPLVVEARREKASRRFSTFLSGDAVRSPPRQPATEANDPITPGGSKFRRKMQSTTPKAKASPGELDLFKEPSSNWNDDEDLDFSVRRKAPNALPTFVARKKAAAIARDECSDNEETAPMTAAVSNHRPQATEVKAATSKSKLALQKQSKKEATKVNEDSEAEFSLSDTQEQSKLPQSASAKHRRGKLKKQRALNSDDDVQEKEQSKVTHPKQQQNQQKHKPHLDPILEETSQQHDAENHFNENETGEPSIIPAAFFNRIPSVWTEAWNSLEALGWYWKPGKGLVDFFYVKPGAKPHRPFIEGQDYFCSTSDVLDYLDEVVRTSGRSTSAAGLASSSSSSSSKNNQQQSLVFAAKLQQQQPEVLDRRENEQEYEMQNDIEFDETQPQLLDIRKAEWKNIWKVLRCQGWKWDYGPDHLNFYYAPNFNYKRYNDAVEGVTKFANEDAVRKYIKKQLKENGPRADDFSMFYVSAKRSHSISNDDSQQADSIDGNWTLGSHRRKRDLMQAMGNSRADTDSVVESIESAPKPATKKRREAPKKDNKTVIDSNGSVASSSLPSEEFLPAQKSQYPFPVSIQSSSATHNKQTAEGVSRPPTGRKQQPRRDEIEKDLSPRNIEKDKYPADLISPQTSASRKNAVPSFLAMSMSPLRVQPTTKDDGRKEEIGRGSNSILLSLNRPSSAQSRDSHQQVMEMVPANSSRKRSALHEDSPTIAASGNRSSAAKAAPGSSSGANRITRSDVSAFLFQNYNFLVSGFTEQKREIVESTIKKYAGRVISKVPADYQELNTLSQQGATEHGRVVLISHPTEFRKPKFIQALIAGVVILHNNWVTDSIARGELAPIRNYLLPSGYSALHSHYIFSNRYRPLLNFNALSNNMPLFVRACTIFQGLKLMNLTGLKIWDDIFLSLGATLIPADQDNYRSLLSMEAGDFFIRSSHGSMSSSSSSHSTGGKRRMNQNRSRNGEDVLVDYILFDPAICARSHAFYTSKTLQRIVATQKKGTSGHSKKDSMINEAELQVLYYCQHLRKEVDEQQKHAASRPPQVASIDWLLHCIFLDALVDVDSLDLFQLPPENSTSSMTYKGDLEWNPPATVMNELILHERFSKHDLIYFAKDMHSRTNRPSVGIGKIVAITRRNMDSTPSIRIMPLSVQRAVSDDEESEHLQLVPPEEKIYTLLTPSQVRGKVILITRHLAPLLTGYIKHADETPEQGPEDHVYVTSQSYEDEWPLKPWQNSQLQDSQHQNSVDERRVQEVAAEQGRPYKRLKFASQDI